MQVASRHHQLGTNKFKQQMIFFCSCDVRKNFPTRRDDSNDHDDDDDEDGVDGDDHDDDEDFVTVLAINKQARAQENFSLKVQKDEDEMRRKRMSTTMTTMTTMTSKTVHRRRQSSSCDSCDGATGSLSVAEAAAAKTTMEANEDRMRMTKTERPAGANSIKCTNLWKFPFNLLAR